MRIWNFLRRQMLKYGDSIAFVEPNISYRKLIDMIENAEIEPEKFIVFHKETKFQQALYLLKVIAHNKVAIPLHHSEHSQFVKEQVTKYSHRISKKSALMMFSSGTTGLPKGVMLSHRNIIQNLKAIDQYFDVYRGQKILICRNIQHISAITGELLYGLFKGLSIIFYEEEFNPIRLAHFIDLHQIEILGLTPTMLFHLKRYLVGEHLKSIVLSGEPLHDKIVIDLKEKFPLVQFYNVYGLTECSPRVSALLPKDFFQKPGSIGKPLRKTKMKIVEQELWVKSPSVMLGYFDQNSLTKERMTRKYLHTNDLVKRDKDGFYYILGRKDDLMIRCGVNIYPLEIENIVHSISGVEKCIAFGKDDLSYGQKICLNYNGEISERELRMALLKSLPLHLLPNEIVKTEALKTSPNGKTLRR